MEVGQSFLNARELIVALLREHRDRVETSLVSFADLSNAIAQRNTLKEHEEYAFLDGHAEFGVDDADLRKRARRNKEAR